LSIGARVLVTIPVVQPAFHAHCSVVWCSRHGAYYEVGVRFDESDEVFTARMVEQVCEIEHYRNEMLRSEGRVLDSETAAKEWVSLYAAQYPSLNGSH
jgi:hypothetical protein